MEVNSTRRTDHSARFQVTAGAFVAAKLHAAQAQSPKLLSTTWASSVGPQGRRAAAPRVLLAQSGLPTLLGYPSNSLAPTQFNQTTPNHLETVVLGLDSSSPFARLPSVAPSSFQCFTPRTLLCLLASPQGFSGAQAHPLVSGLSVGLAYPASPWFFRPSVFSQTRLFFPH